MFIRSSLALAGIVALAAVLSGPLVEPVIQGRLLRLRLSNYYAVHAPSQLEKVEGLIERCNGDEALVQALIEKIEGKYEVPVPEADIWELQAVDPIGVGAYVAYTEVKKRVLRLVDVAEGHFPHAREDVTATLARLEAQRMELLNFASAPAQLILLALAYVLLASRLRGGPRAIALLAVALVVGVVVHPGVDDLAPASLHAGLEELLQAARKHWSKLAMPVQVAALATVTVVCALSVLRHHRSFAVFVWLLAALALSNPRAPMRASALDAVAQLGVADASSLALFVHSEESLFAVKDITFFTVLTLSSSATTSGGLPGWNAPILALGLADRWFVLSRVEASKTDEMQVRIDLPGLPAPLYFGPLALGSLLLVAALLSGL
ncbi:hypothetical protein T492DRAFT_983374 [Pavlovales sp. CCMP2436]|nr:hypothetical protein T492DRAFT_983374 [Pavlovales sp. CCMP2436]